MTRWTAAVWLAVGLSVAPALPLAAREKPAAAPSALQARIDDIIGRYQGGSQRPPLDEVKAVVDAVKATGGYDGGLWQVYAYSLARAKQFDEAIAVIDDLIRHLDADGMGETQDMGDSLLARAVFMDLKGDGDGALATRYKAQAVYVKLGGPKSPRANTIKAQIASSLFARGQMGEALKLYGEALPMLAGDADSVRVYAVQMSNYANALRLQGDLAGALEASRTAVEVSRAKLPPDHPAILFALHNLGTTLMELGRYGEAESVLREGLEIARAQGGKKNVDTLGLMYRLAQVLGRENHDEEATILLRAALDGLDGVPLGSNPDLPGLIRLELADNALKRGDRAAARTELTAGLDSTATAGAAGDLTRARLRCRLGEALFLDGDYAGAAEQVGLALAFYRGNVPEAAPDRVRAAMLDALIAARTGQASAYERGDAVRTTMLDYMNGKAALRQESTDLVAVYRLSFQRFGEIALVTGHPDDALQSAQWAAYTEIAATSQALAVRAAADDPQAADLLRRLQDAQELRLRLDRERTFAHGRSVAEEARLDGEIAAADGTLNDLTGQVVARFPDYARLSRPNPVTVAAIGRDLPRDHALLIPVTGDDRLITLVVTRQGLTWDSAPLPRAGAEAAADRIRTSLDATLHGTGPSGFDRAAAWTLGGAIFTPKIRTALKKTREIEVLGSGPLMTLPLGLLLTEAPRGADNDAAALRSSAWLIRSFAVSVKPALVPPAPVVAGTSGFLGVGAPVLGPAADGFAAFDPGLLYRGGPDRDELADVAALRTLPSLPHAEDELKRMNSALALPGSRLITGADATESRIKSTDLSGYSVIAFATHGLISGNLATLREPALVLTPPTEPSAEDDGLLTASDVAGLHLRARWVILSACNTGSGREAGAAGYSGLARAFMQAGSESLLVSLWPVRDDVADRLSVDTVRRNARGVPQAEALRRAILNLIDDPSVPGSANPAIWAPFSLVVR